MLCEALAVPVRTAAAKVEAAAEMRALREEPGCELEGKERGGANRDVRAGTCKEYGCVKLCTLAWTPILVHGRVVYLRGFRICRICRFAYLIGFFPDDFAILTVLNTCMYALLLAPYKRT